jgi:hypothetical protein
VIGITIYNKLAGYGDGLAHKVDVLEVGAFGYQHGVVGGSRVNASLDGGLVGGNMNDLRAKD